MPFLSDYARKKKVEYFLRFVPQKSRILEVGSGDGWLGRYLRSQGWENYTGIDIRPPADIVGDILNWKALGVEPESYDVIMAFEVVEHVPCFQEAYEILRPGGLLFLTSPVPSMDWLCGILETLRLTQPRTSPHTHLVRFEQIPLFEPIEIRRVGLAAQWGVFRKPLKSVQTSA
jgi:SAM-dependent methyltransferase